MESIHGTHEGVALDAAGQPGAVAVQCPPSLRRTGRGTGGADRGAGPATQPGGHRARGRPGQVAQAEVRGRGRRAAGRAMLLLQQRGRLPNEHEVLRELVPSERLLEVSLA